MKRHRHRHRQRQRPRPRQRSVAVAAMLALTLALVAGGCGSGERVDVGDHELFLVCEGDGSPTVVLENGLGAQWGNWEQTMALISPTTRVCAYDRAGMGESDEAEVPRTTSDMVDDLELLLEAADVGPPYVLAGWSIGGFNVRLFAEENPGVVGVVLVDSSHPEQVPRLLDVLPADSGEAAVNDLRASLISFADDPFSNDETLDVAASAAEVSATRLGAMPLIVLSSTELNSGLSPELSADVIAASHAMDRELAELSSQGVHRVVDGTSHCIHCDDPEAVAEAILEVVERTNR